MFLYHFYFPHFSASSPVLVQSPQRSNIPSSVVFFAFVAPVLLNIYPFSSPVFLPPDSN